LAARKLGVQMQHQLDVLVLPAMHLSRYQARLHFCTLYKYRSFF